MDATIFPSGWMATELAWPAGVVDGVLKELSTLPSVLNLIAEIFPARDPVAMTFPSDCTATPFNGPPPAMTCDHATLPLTLYFTAILYELIVESDRPTTAIEPSDKTVRSWSLSISPTRG